MNPGGGRIVIVDSDYECLGSLARVLRDRQHHVVLATDGRSGLSRAVELGADVVLLAEDVPVLDAQTFLEVLRDNPRTSSARTFLLRREGARYRSPIDEHIEPIWKPFQAEEVAARIAEAIFERRKLAPAAELRGELGPSTVVELLHAIEASRRTGQLRIDAEGGEASLFFAEGCLVEALVGRANGDKALQRILSLASGRYVFVPDVRSPRIGFESKTSALVQEALARLEEEARLRAMFPADAGQLTLLRLPERLSPLAAAVTSRLSEPRTLRELLDVLPSPDVEVLRAVQELLETGCLRFARELPSLRLLSEEDLAAFRSAATRLRRPGFKGPLRLAVLADSGDGLRRFIRALGAIREFVPAAAAEAALSPIPLGAFGSIRFEGIEVELFALPPEPTLWPLSRAMLAPLTRVLVLEPSADLVPMLRALDLRMVTAPPGWDRPSGTLATLRAAFGRLARNPSTAQDEVASPPDARFSR